MGKPDAWNMASTLLLPLLSFGFGIGLLNWTLGRADMKLSMGETYGFLFLSAALMVAGTLTYFRQQGFGWLTTSIAATIVAGALALFLVPKLEKREERVAEDKANRAQISGMAEGQRRAEERAARTPPVPEISITTMSSLRLANGEPSVPNSDRFREHEVTLVNHSSEPLVNVRLRFQLPAMIVRIIQDANPGVELQINGEAAPMDYTTRGSGAVAAGAVVASNVFIISVGTLPHDRVARFWIRTDVASELDLPVRDGLLSNYIDGRYQYSRQPDQPEQTFVVPLSNVEHSIRAEQPITHSAARRSRPSRDPEPEA